MEDFIWLFFILGAVIILVVLMWLKAFSSPKPSTTTRPTTPKAYPVPAPPATSYRDILKEMQASGERVKKVNSPASLESKETREKTGREARSLEQTETRARSLETIIITPKEVIRKPSAIEIARYQKPRTTLPVPTAVDYGKLLQNPQNIRTAFILAEILTHRVDYWITPQSLKLSKRIRQ